MIRILVCLLLSSFSVLPAQEQPTQAPVPEMYSSSAIVEEQNKIYERVELEPQFPAGGQTLNTWIINEIELARQKKNLPRATLPIKLLIEKNGTIGNVVFLETPNKKLKKETLEIIKRMPSWRAAQQNGKPVRAYIKIEFIW